MLFEVCNAGELEAPAAGEPNQRKLKLVSCRSTKPCSCWAIFNPRQDPKAHLFRC